MIKFHKFFILIGIFLFTACGGSYKVSKNKIAENYRPNIVFIMADDLGIGDIGVYGQDIFKTPNIDQLAAEGMKFNNFYAGSTVCAPSRAALLTGQHTGNTEVRGNGEFPLDPNKIIIPEVLKKQEYTTAMYGKWGLGLAGSTSSPEKRGWDEFLGHLHHIDAHYQQPDSLDVIKNGELTKIATPDDSYANELFTDAAVDFIKEQEKNNPFFLYLSFTIPHAELVVPDEFLEDHLTAKGASMYKPEKAWPAGRHYGPQKFPKAAYAALVESIDTYVGQILTTLEKQGYNNNTLVIFTSDNGTHLEGGRRQSDVDFFKSSGEHRGVKRDLYEGGIKEPFLVKWPGVVEAGSTSDFKGAFWDLFPTFAELSGADFRDEKIDGISFVPSLTGTGIQKKHDYLYWEFHEFGGKQALLKDNWKVIRLGVNENPNAPVALYNLKSDPAEKNDLAKKFPKKTENLRKLMDSVRSPNDNFDF